ncbi:helix-turn-helix domain-containing protein [Limibacterium fermenti]|uniref:helix-turn-helix domain-containing protein n=1 Tax=Limibacterium fermenti TaxID=3229863 RepID=UPI003A5F0762
MSDFCSQMIEQKTNDILLSAIALRIKQFREERSITQEVFTFDTNINIGRIESGKSNITISTLYKICKYMDISLADFFNGFSLEL